MCLFVISYLIVLKLCESKDQKPPLTTDMCVSMSRTIMMQADMQTVSNAVMAKGAITRRVKTFYISK